MHVGEVCVRQSDMGYARLSSKYMYSRGRYANRTSCGCRRRCRGPRGSFAAPYPSSRSETASFSMWELKKVVRQTHQYIDWQIKIYLLCRKFNLTFNSSNFHPQPSAASKAMAERKSIHISIVDIFRRKAKTAHRQGSKGTLARKAKRRQANKLVENYFAKPWRPGEIYSDWRKI